MVDAVAPGEDDIVLPKTSSSLFNSTNFDYLLRNIGIEALVEELRQAGLDVNGRRDPE